PLTDFGGKTSIFSHSVYLFLREFSLQDSRGGSLTLNIIVLWNTIYMDAAIQQLRREGYPVLDSDVEKLSPLQCGHINMQGRYSFIVPESVSKGELRAFNEDV
ncbi:Tn3 family transposase, partial [Escherichia coli]